MERLTTVQAIGLAMRWSERGPWRAARTICEHRQRAKASEAREWQYITEEERRDERRFDDEWFRMARAHARQLNEEAEIYRCQLIDFGGELLALANYCRLNAPELLPLVPNVSFLDDAPSDFEPHIAKLVELESKLRLLRGQRWGDSEELAKLAGMTVAATRSKLSRLRAARKLPVDACKSVGDGREEFHYLIEATLPLLKPKVKS